MTLLDAAEAALAELKVIHASTKCVGQGTGIHCHGPEHCPTAAAIRDLELAISEARLAEMATKLLQHHMRKTGFELVPSLRDDVPDPQPAPEAYPEIKLAQIAALIGDPKLRKAYIELKRGQERAEARLAKDAMP